MCCFFYQDTHHEYTSQFGQTPDEDLHIEQSYIGQRLARIPKEELYLVHRSPKKQVWHIYVRKSTFDLT